METNSRIKEEAILDYQSAIWRSVPQSRNLARYEEYARELDARTVHEGRSGANPDSEIQDDVHCFALVNRPHQNVLITTSDVRALRYEGLTKINYN